MGISDQVESELVHVESKASIHIGNEDGKGVNTEVWNQSLRAKRRSVRPLKWRRAAHRRDYKSAGCSRSVDGETRRFLHRFDAVLPCYNRVRLGLTRRLCR